MEDVKQEATSEDVASGTPRYPDIEVQLSGEDGNAFAIISRVRVALRKAGVPREEMNEFSSDATSGDYDHVLQTCMKWVSVS